MHVGRDVDVRSLAKTGVKCSNREGPIALFTFALFFIRMSGKVWRNYCSLLWFVTVGMLISPASAQGCW